MRYLTRTTTPETFIAAYGQEWRQGLISEHLELFQAAGGDFRPGGSTVGWAVIDGKAFPVLCSELVRIDTEDGPVSGRCGGTARPADGCCDAHAGAYDSELVDA